ncbi:hypothetical protein CDD83_7258 [Cordyceps sp. RAO-2017]|nr:hypothetical protein CDD83_7258 [Cordyceps sp. RAO-2017]
MRGGNESSAPPMADGRTDSQRQRDREKGERRGATGHDDQAVVAVPEAVGARHRRVRGSASCVAPRAVDDAPPPSSSPSSPVLMGRRRLRCHPERRPPSRLPLRPGLFFLGLLLMRACLLRGRARSVSRMRPSGAHRNSVCAAQTHAHWKGERTQLQLIHPSMPPRLAPPGAQEEGRRMRPGPGGVKQQPSRPYRNRDSPGPPPTLGHDRQRQPVSRAWYGRLQTGDRLTGPSRERGRGPACVSSTANTGPRETRDLRRPCFCGAGRRTGDRPGSSWLFFFFLAPSPPSSLDVLLRALSSD